jgi:protein-tyrosine phosphatase
VLADAGVSTVVDLRTASERADRPNLLVSVGQMQSVNAPIFEDDTEFPSELTTATDVYCWWLRDLGAGIKTAMTAIADAPSAPVLVHCHAGKDRTGVIVALALLLAGVGSDAIADDYALSGAQLADMLARDRVSAVERGMDAVRAERLFTVRREAMVETVERIQADHGGAAKYLADLGVDEPRIVRLRRLLVAPEWP